MVQINTSLPGAAGPLGLPGGGLKPTLPMPGKGIGGPSFGDMLKNALDKTNQLQLDSSVKTKALLSGESKNLHETMIAMEKAGIAFRFMNQIRTRAVEAYRELLRMQI